MEEKKLDINSLIGFILIGGILIWMLYMNQSAPEAIEEEAGTEEVVVTPEETPTSPDQANLQVTDSAAIAQAQSRLGAFGYSATLPSAKENTTTIENDVLELKVENKGGYISEARLKNFKTFDSIPVLSLIHI